MTKNELDTYVKTYEEWKNKVEPLAKAFYSDPFTNQVERENFISYVHKFHIGGSVDSQILGVNKYASKQEAYENMIEFKPHEDKFVFERGHYLEPFVAKQFSKLTRIKHKKGTAAQVENRPWSFAQVDFLTNDDTPLEIKVSSAKNQEQEDGLGRLWGRGCEFNDLGDLLKVDSMIPVEYLVQCQKQMWALNKQSMWLCVWLTWENKVRAFKIERDDQLIEAIDKAEIDFLFNHVIPKVPYENENALEEPIAVDEDPRSCYATEELLEKLQDLKTINKQKLALDKQSKELTAQIKEALGDFESAINSQGKVLCTLTKQTRQSLDTKSLMNSLPEYMRSQGVSIPENYFDQFYKVSEISPKLTIKEV